MSTLGERLKKLREINNYSQKRVADALKISNVQLSRYESDTRQPDYDTLLKISDFFGKSVDYLLTGKEKEKVSENPNLFFFDMEGLSEEEIQDIQSHIEYVKWKAKQNKK